MSEQIEDLIQRVRELVENNTTPPSGWTRSSLDEDVQTSLLKADTASPQGHKHDSADISGLEALYASKSHTHKPSDVGASTSPSPNTIPLRDSSGLFEIYEATSPNQPVALSQLNRALSGKSNSTHTHTIGEIPTLLSALNSKAGREHTHTIDEVADLREELEKRPVTNPALKADLVSGKVPVGQIPDIPSSKVLGLSGQLLSKASLEFGKVPLSQLPDIPVASIKGLDGALSSYAKTTNGKLDESIIPESAFQTARAVDTLEELYSLSNASVGDIVVVRKVGTYSLIDKDSSKPDSWLKHEGTSSEGGGSSAVTSVNGKIGDVQLSAEDVGARSAGPIPQSDVEGLVGALDSKLNASAASSFVTREALPTVTNAVLSPAVIAPVDCVSTTRILTLSGTQSVDGIVVQAGQRVLLTAQPSSSQNGIWVVSTTSWVRPKDFDGQVSILPGSVVPVYEGTTQANTLWRASASSVITPNTTSHTWTRVLGGAVESSGVDFVTGLGLSLNDKTLSVKAGSDIIVDSNGVSLDPTNVLRKYATNVPGGSQTATIQHNLGTKDVTVSVIEVSSGDYVLADIRILSSSSIQVSFESSPTSGQYRVVVHG